MNNRLLLIFLLAVATAACDYSHIRDESSEFFSIPVGSTLVLNQEIIIPPDQVSVLLQNGGIRQHANIDLYQPNCKFELYRISEDARRVMPGQFLIIKVVDENEFTDLQETRFASRRFMADDGAPETITYATVMYLQSDIQQDVYRMTCKHWESVIDDRYLTVSEMRKAMGDVFTLRILY